MKSLKKKLQYLLNLNYKELFFTSPEKLIYILQKININFLDAGLTDKIDGKVL